MEGLIFKDLILVKKISVWIVGLWIFYFFLGRGAPFPFVLISLILIFYPLVIDDRFKTEPLFVSLAITKKEVVQSRYVSALLTILMVIIFTFFSSCLLNLFWSSYFTKITSIERLLYSHYPIVFIAIVLFPIFFRFGGNLEQGMKVVAGVIVALFAFGLGMIYILDKISFDILGIKFFPLYLGIFLSILYYLSYRASLKIFYRRDF
jgi:hypothetical protein